MYAFVLDFKLALKNLISQLLKESFDICMKPKILVNAILVVVILPTKDIRMQIMQVTRLIE